MNTVDGDQFVVFGGASPWLALVAALFIWASVVILSANTFNWCGSRCAVIAILVFVRELTFFFNCSGRKIDVALPLNILSTPLSAPKDSSVQSYQMKVNDHPICYHDRNPR